MAGLLLLGTEDLFRLGKRKYKNAYKRRLQYVVVQSIEGCFVKKQAEDTESRACVEYAIALGKAVTHFK